MTATIVGTRLTVLDGGTSYHAFAIGDDSLGRWYDRRLYVEAADADALADSAVVVVPCRLNPDWLAAHADLLIDVLRRGDTLVVMGETEPERWLPDADQTPVPTNFWWWLDPEAELGLTVGAATHGLYRYLSLADAIWHYHGHFQVPPGAVSVIDAPEGGSVLVDDRASWPGRLLLTSLDPFYHHGSFFMPAASRFLRGFCRWLGDGLPD